MEHKSMNILFFLLVGLVAGWLAGLLLKGRGFGLIVNMIVGVLGAFAGGYLFDVLGLEWGGTLGAIWVATIGAFVLLLIISFVKKAK